MLTLISRLLFLLSGENMKLTFTYFIDPGLNVQSNQFVNWQLVVILYNYTYRSVQNFPQISISTLGFQSGENLVLINAMARLPSDHRLLTDLDSELPGLRYWFCWDCRVVDGDKTVQCSNASQEVGSIGCSKHFFSKAGQNLGQLS